MYWLLVVFLLYWSFLELLRRKGILERRGLRSYGPVLLIRTSRGLKLIEKISEARNLWKSLSTIGLPAVFFGMFFMFSLIIVADIIMVISPPKPSELTTPQAALLIPGLNPFIPLIWGLIGLVVAIFVHELSHAILCRVENIKVKALGLILALFPIGAFAEPDETELFDKKTKRVSRIRIFSVGVITNFFVAFVAFAFFFNSLSMLNPEIAIVDDSGEFVARILEVNDVKAENGFLQLLKPNEPNRFLVENSSGKKEIIVFGVRGVKITGLYRDNMTYPAEIAGMKEGMMITRIDGVKVENIDDFYREMKRKEPWQNVTIEVYDGDFKTFNLTLVNKDGRAFMGVYVGNLECIGGVNVFYTSQLLSTIQNVPSTLRDPIGWVFVISMPFTFQGFSQMKEFFNNPPEVFWLLDSLYWIAWINFYVALFNCLPAIPLDGGRVFHEIVSAIFSRRFGEKGERIALNISRFFAIFIFTSLIFMIVIPNLRL
ncbi:MAG: site-2 protease family protein [Archaeoglobaceae archaeon]